MNTKTTRKAKPRVQIPTAEAILSYQKAEGLSPTQAYIRAFDTCNHLRPAHYQGIRGRA